MWHSLRTQLAYFGRLLVCHSCNYTLGRVRKSRTHGVYLTFLHVLEAVLARSLSLGRRLSLAHSCRTHAIDSALGARVTDDGTLSEKPCVYEAVSEGAPVFNADDVRMIAAPLPTWERSIELLAPIDPQARLFNEASANRRATSKRTNSGGGGDDEEDGAEDASDDDGAGDAYDDDDDNANDSDNDGDDDAAYNEEPRRAPRRKRRRRRTAMATVGGAKRDGDGKGEAVLGNAIHPSQLYTSHDGALSNSLESISRTLGEAVLFDRLSAALAPRPQIAGSTDVVVGSSGSPWHADSTTPTTTTTTTPAFMNARAILSQEIANASDMLARVIARCKALAQFDRDQQTSQFIARWLEASARSQFSEQAADGDAAEMMAAAAATTSTSTTTPATTTTTTTPAITRASSELALLEERLESLRPYDHRIAFYLHYRYYARFLGACAPSNMATLLAAGTHLARTLPVESTSWGLEIVARCAACSSADILAPCATWINADGTLSDLSAPPRVGDRAIVATPPSVPAQAPHVAATTTTTTSAAAASPVVAATATTIVLSVDSAHDYAQQCTFVRSRFQLLRSYMMLLSRLAGAGLAPRHQAMLRDVLVLRKQHMHAYAPQDDDGEGRPAPAPVRSVQANYTTLILCDASTPFVIDLSALHSLVSALFFANDSRALEHVMLRMSDAECAQLEASGLCSLVFRDWLRTTFRGDASALPLNTVFGHPFYLGQCAFWRNGKIDVVPK